VPQRFTVLDPANPRSIADAAQQLHQALNDHHAPRSLAELSLSDAEVQWLDDWARQMSPHAVRWCDDTHMLAQLSATRQQAFGLLFPAMAAETARREASEGQVWTSVRRKLSAQAHDDLFVQGQPKQSLIDAIESACRH